MSSYTEGLALLESSYAQALEDDVGDLVSAIQSVSQSSLIGVGSGGSFTSASLLCSLHEQYSGNVSRPSTPLEIICNPSLAASSPAFFISAEGNNPDIVEALVRARRQSARAIHVLTNSNDSRLVEAVGSLRDVRLHVFPRTRKDGYLATHTLVQNAVLISRAFQALAPRSTPLPGTMGGLRLAAQSIPGWLSDVVPFVAECQRRGCLVIVYSPALRALAADLESKLAESALVHVQMADIRSFAHGRHLWLAKRIGDFALLGLIDPLLESLWNSMLGNFPDETIVGRMGVSPSDPGQLVAALVAQMHFVGQLADYSGMDPGKPFVPDFGRRLYNTNVGALVPTKPGGDEGGSDEKFGVLGARWPYIVNRGAMDRARAAFQEEIERQFFRALVFDYDGTLRTTSSEDLAPHADVTSHLARILEADIRLAIVSGRGQSLKDRLREAIEERHWSKVHLGLYNGGWGTDLANVDEPGEGTSEFLNHVFRIVQRLVAAGAPIKEAKRNSPYQLSIRFFEGVDTAAMWFVVADALRGAGLDVDGLVRSRHSIDVLVPGVSKPAYISNLVRSHSLLPQELIVFGDQGAWPGNDAAMLEHRFSLSVDFPSRRLDRGWKLAPAEIRGVDAMLWYFDRMRIGKGGFRLAFIGQSAGT